MQEITHNVVPARLLNIVTAHDKPDPQRNLFGIDASDEQDIRIEPLIAKARESKVVQYTNDWTGHEIEVLAVLVDRARRQQGKGWGRTATFKSLHQIARLADGSEIGRRRDRYKEAIESLQRNHWMLYTHKGTPVLCSTPPISVSTTNEIRESGEREYIKITLAPELFFEAKDATRCLPAGLAHTLRSNGIQRVGDHHIKLCVYLAERFGEEHRQTIHRLKTLANRAGLEDYFKQRNGARARRIIQDTIDALRNAGAFLYDDQGRKGEYILQPNPAFWLDEHGQKLDGERISQKEPRNQKVVKRLAS